MKEGTTNFNYYYDFIKNSLHFSELNDEVIKEMLDVFYVETWKKGNFRFNDQKTKNKFYLIISGRVKIFQIDHRRSD